MKVNLQDTKVGAFDFEFLRGISIMRTGGAELGECLETISKIHDNDFDSWVTEWENTAHRAENEGVSYAAKGLNVAARNAFLRASSYYRMAVFYSYYREERHALLLEKSVTCFHRAARLMSLSIEFLDIDFEGARLPAYFISGDGGKRPTLIALGGFDSTMEEMYHFIGAAAAEYGWNCLIFEGPGQWSALTRNPGLVFRPDYEKPVKAVVDYALSRPDVDGDKLALIGYSLGGYLAPRAAAFDSRIKACIANNLVFDFREAVTSSFVPPSGDVAEISVDSIFSKSGPETEVLRWMMGHAQWTMGIEQPQELFEATEPYTLKGLEERIKCPMLMLFGEEEIANIGHKFVSETINFVSTLDCDRTFHIFTKLEGAGSHCQMGGISLAQAVIFEWLNDTLCCDKPQTFDGKHKLVVPDELIEIIGRYHGDGMVATLKHIQSAK
ncbi:MAG TPA: hypothetical protein VEG44_09775 [Candidatus Acidoferrales bacterium]|nr:hypothetical protein [Candidatus Acidoferrales bacterium]